MKKAIAEVLDLIPAASQRLRGITVEAARAPAARKRRRTDRRETLEGSYALVARQGEKVALARSLDRPLRYFLAKVAAGPMLVVAERLDQIRDALAVSAGWESVPPELHPHGAGLSRHAHRARRLPRSQSAVPARPSIRRAAGCPPISTGSARPTSARCSRRHAPGLRRRQRPSRSACSSPAASTAAAVLLALYRRPARVGQSPARLKAFTLAVRRRRSRRRPGAGLPAPRRARDPRRDDRRLGRRARSAGRGRGHRGLQAARRRVRGGDAWRWCAASARATPTGASRRRRRRRREPEGVSDRGEHRAHHPQRGLESAALPGGLGRRGDQALADLLRRA